MGGSHAHCTNRSLLLMWAWLTFLAQCSLVVQGTGLSLSHAAFTKPQVAWHAGQLKTLTHKKKVPQISEHAGDCPALKKTPLKKKLTQAISICQRNLQLFLMSIEIMALCIFRFIWTRPLGYLKCKSEYYTTPQPFKKHYFWLNYLKWLHTHLTTGIPIWPSPNYR